MPELPDLVILARSMDQALQARTIAATVVNQPKSLNLPPEEFTRAVTGRTFRQVRQRGKWALADLDRDWMIAFNLGMGGELRLHGADETPDPRRERVTFRLDDGRQLWAHFWWFGMVHVVPLSQLEAHPQIGKLGPEPLADDFTAERLARMLAGRRGAIKKYLLDQSFVAGIGNVYIQEMLWRARLHPLRPANTLTPADVERLYTAMRETLEKGIRWNGGPGEQDVWGNPGRYHEHFFDTFGEGKPCPACGATIQAIRVGSTGSLICPQCQAWPL